MTGHPIDLQDRLEAAVARHGVPGASAAVRVGNAIVLAHCGTTSLHGGNSVSGDTTFEIGSVTKSYTAAALLVLVAKGALDLDTAVVDVLPDVAVDASVTVRQLLNHTSGIDSDHILDTGDGEDALQRYAETLGQVEQVTPAGAVFSYNNTAYVLAGRLLEHVVGGSWRTAIRQLVLDPLGARDTFTSAGEAPAARLARGHVAGPEGLVVAPQAGVPRSLEPAGGLCATAGDVLRLADVYLGRADLLPPEVVELARTSSVAVPDPSVGRAWGLGLSIQHLEPLVVGHDGGTVGHVASMRVVPEKDVAVVVCVNSTAHGGDVVQEVVDGVLADLAGVPARPSVAPAGDAPGALQGVFERQGFRISVGDGRVEVSLNELASAALGTDTLRGELRATEVPNVFAVDVFGPGEWTPLVVSDVGGRRYVHLNGRAHEEAR